MSARRDIVHSPEAQALKIATRALTRSAGGTDAAAATVGGRQQRLSDCGCRNTPDFARIDEVAALEDVTLGTAGWPHVTRVLAARQGFALLPIPALDRCDDALHEVVCGIMRETGEVLTEIGAAFADGQVDERERRRVDQSIEEAIVQLTKARALVGAAAEPAKLQVDE